MALAGPGGSERGGIRRLGVMTSGGDCAGLNACLRAIIARAAGHYGWEVLGIADASHGLMERPVRVRPLGLDLVDGPLLRAGGTMLGTVNSGDPFRYPMSDGSVADRSAEVREGYQLAGLDALICIGGDGSQRIMHRLAEGGAMRVVAVPKTIDNDLACTDFAIGYMSAVRVAVDALDHLQPTAASHRRVMVLEVMGRDAGHIALSAGIAGGADVVLLPEVAWHIGAVAAALERLRARGRNHALVVVAEGARTEDGTAVARPAVLPGGMPRLGGIGHHVAERIEEATDAECRVTVLGHVQRGGTPGVQDRLIAAAYGVHAVDLVAEGRFGRMVAWQGREVTDVPVEEAVAATQPVDLDGPLVRTARGLGICLGDL
ncbi:MAG: ATP-dependent 6-phosphofructokinase [Alphaproteobacteria bacterium]|nr:ATP-dependent 6-phosphofructokinase [Alphaproteobacteria bacterium]